jgi:hypothetical protein
VVLLVSAYFCWPLGITAAVTRHRLVGSLLVLAVALAGCSPVGDRAESAESTAVGFLRDVAAGNGAAACALLAPNTVAELEQSDKKGCAEAIVGEDLPRPGTASGTSVYGQWAQVHLTDDTVFLAVFPGGWRVVAAGCTPQGDRPYDCTLQGS